MRFWNLQTGDCCQILQGHTRCIESLEVSSDGRSLASCGRNETIILWDLETGDRRHTLRAERLYEGMNITDVRGVSDVEVATLEALGAVRDLAVGRSEDDR